MPPKRIKSVINGHLDVFFVQNIDEHEGEVISWNDILIHGDPEGLRSLAGLLLKLADLDQESIDDLQKEAREHVHLQPGYDLAKSSDHVIVGRLDAKGTGKFYDRYVSK